MSALVERRPTGRGAMAATLGAWVAVGAIGRLEWVVPGYWMAHDLHVSLPGGRLTLAHVVRAIRLVERAWRAVGPVAVYVRHDAAARDVHATLCRLDDRDEPCLGERWAEAGYLPPKPRPPPAPSPEPTPSDDDCPF